MWVHGRKTIPGKDFNRVFADTLKGELQEDAAKKTFGRFVKYNVGIAVRMLTGFSLYPDQRLMIKGWLGKNHTMTIASRGLGKSWVFSHFCYLYCLLNPGKTVIMIAPTFRSSRKIVENIDKWANSKDGTILRNCIKRNGAGMLVTKKPDSYIVEFTNGSQIIALPLGDGEKLRGYRASVLAIDEGLLIAQTIIDTVLKPFLVATPEEEIKRRQKIRRAEERKVKAGRLKREDMTKFGSDAKMIILSSASYSWQDLFTLYKKYLKIIYAEDDVMMAKLSEEEKKKLAEEVATDTKDDKSQDDDIAATYLVHQLSYEIAPLDRLDKAVRDEISGGMYSENTIAREYKAQFVQDSDGYFRAKTMEECTLHGDNAPCPELVGETGAEYLLAIDPNMGGSETNDHFAMCVIKIVEKEMSDKTKRKVGLVVHQYANAGAELVHHIDYLYYLWNHFNIVYIACDTSQGDNMDFISVANTGPQFASRKIVLRALEVDFGKETFDHLVEEIQRSYNKSDHCIVQKQYFHAAFQRAANEWLQTSFNRRTILFTAKALANPTVMDRLYHQDVGEIIDTHPDFATPEGGRGSRDDFIEQQDLLTDLVKKECALIEIKTSSLGNTSYDLPQHVKRGSRNAGRLRKDSWAALVLGNWALKLYLEAQERPQETHPVWMPSWAR